MAEKNEKIDALDVSKVKNVTDLIIKPNHVLIMIKEFNKSTLILPAGARTDTTVWEIVKVGDNVPKQYEVGQYVIDLSLSNIEYMTKGEERYILADSYNLLLTCNKDNYEFGE